MKVRTITINWVTQPLNLNCFHHITLYYLLTYSMEHSPSEANRSSTSQEICLILWNPKVRYCLHKCPPHIPILSQLDPVHTLTSYFLNIYFIIILPCTPGSPDLVSFPQISEPKSCLRLSSHTYTLHAPTISFFSILSTENYWLNITDHSALHYVVSYTPLSPHPPGPK